MSNQQSIFMIFPPDSQALFVNSDTTKSREREIFNEFNFHLTIQNLKEHKPVVVFLKPLLNQLMEKDY